MIFVLPSSEVGFLGGTGFTIDVKLSSTDKSKSMVKPKTFFMFSLQVSERFQVLKVEVVFEEYR